MRRICLAVSDGFSNIDGFPQSQRSAVARLFWAAFKDKLNPVMKPESKALQFIEMVADPAYAVCALAPDGALLGVAGFKTKSGGFIGGGLTELCAVYGFFGGIWRGLVLSLLERPLEPETLLMDGIFVEETARGMGIGTALLKAIKDKARACNCTKVRLDVIDINPRARALYERQGFQAGATSDIGVLQHIFGFQKSTTMICDV